MASENPEQLDSMINRAFGSCVIKEKIAIGGFGTVYKAFDEKLDIPRAIKIFHPHLSGEKGFQKRFEIEMRLLAQLDHLNIVRVISAIEEPDCTGFTMEYVEGKTLADILEEQGAFVVQESIDIFTQVAKSIAYAHNLKDQIIHRDLSPDNIMIRPDGVVKIMDFGIAKTIGSEKVTQTGIVLGKPTYMAPEQFEGTVSTFTDQYALGIILYEMITGRVPFDAESPIALYKLHLNEEAITPNEINDQIPLYLDKIVLKAIAKEEGDRFDNVDKIVEALNSRGTSSKSVENKIPSLMVDVSLAIKDEDFEKALSIVNEVLELEPSNKEALAKKEEVHKLKRAHERQDILEESFHQAIAFHEASMNEEAYSYVQDFFRISLMYPKSATVKRHQNTLEKKMPELYQKAKEQTSDEWERVDHLAKIGKKLFQRDNFADALKKFEQALEINPYYEWLTKLKKLCEKKIKMAQVAENYRDGIIAIKNEDYENALKSFEIVLQLYPQHKEARKYKKMAQNELDKVARNRSELESAYKEALDLYEKWEFTSAISKFERVLELDETNLEAKMLLSESLARSDDENKIEEIGFFYNQGMTFFKGQQWQKAIKCFDRVLKYMENHKGALEYKSLAETKITQQKKLEDSFQEALEHFRNSSYTQAVNALEYILAIDKNHKGARQYRALCEELRGLGPETANIN